MGDAPAIHPSIHPSVSLAVPQCDNSGFEIWSVSLVHLSYLQAAQATGDLWCTYTGLSNNRDHMEYIVTSNLHPYIFLGGVATSPPQTPKPPETVSVDSCAQGKRLTILGGLNLSGQSGGLIIRF